MLADGAHGLARPQEKVAAPFEIPDRSQLVVRGTGAAIGALSLEVRGSDGAIDASRRRPPATPTDVSELKLEVRKSGTVTVHAGGIQLLSWPFQVIPDHPPKIAITKDPEKSPRGALKLFFKVEDDYGVVSAESRIRRVRPKEDKTATAWARAGAKKGARPPLRAAAGAGAAATARLPQAGRGPKLPRDRRPSLGGHEGRADARRQGPCRPDRAQRHQSSWCCPSGASPSRWRARSSSSGAGWPRTRATARRWPAPSTR